MGYCKLIDSKKMRKSGKIFVFKLFKIKLKEKYFLENFT